MVPLDARYDADELAPSLMNVVEKIFAAGMVVACVLLLARMLLRPRRRARVDATLRKEQRALAGAACAALVAWPAAELRARRETKEAIRRARRSAIERDGNVISPKAFKGRRRDLH